MLNKRDHKIYLELGHLSLIHLCIPRNGKLLTKKGFLTIDDPQLGHIRVTPSLCIRDSGNSGSGGGCAMTLLIEPDYRIKIVSYRITIHIAWVNGNT